MRIIIVGAGEVGTHIASLLCDDHDVVIVEKDKARCRRLSDQHNVLVVEGNGAHPETLYKAGLSKASLLVAVTQSDAVNLTACLIAKLAGIEKQKRVIRLEASQLDPQRSARARQLVQEVGADLVVDPDHAVAQAIEELLAFGYPGVAEHASMGDGTVLMLDFLESISVDRYDAVLALTGDDETNILSCLYAKTKGVREAITLLHRLALKPLTEQLDIDVAFSPRTSCANEVLRFVLSPDSQENGAGSPPLAFGPSASGVQQIATFLTMNIEVLEFTVDPNSKVVDKSIAEVGFNKKYLIGAVIRQTNGKPTAFIARGETVFRVDDHLIVFAKHDDIDEVGKYFCA